VKKKTFILFPLLAMFLSSCLFDSDDDGLSSWLSDQGMPSSYKVQMVEVDGLKPESAKLYRDTLPHTASSRGFLGAASGLVHDAVFDFAIDSAFLADMKEADSAKAYLSLYLFDGFYKFKNLPSNVLPIEEDLKLNVSWIVSEKLNTADYYALESVVDTVWMNELKSWKTKKKADTTISVSITKKDSLLILDMPSAFVDDVRKNSGNRRLQLRISAPEASHVYRFYGPGSGLLVSPLLYMVEMKNNSYKGYRANRAATMTSNREECSDCLVLHSGVYDSLVVEFPSKPIMKALSDFYGDKFPYEDGNGVDVRQAVIMAELTFYRDDSMGENELGLPVRVVAVTYADSADKVVRSTESYIKFNDSLVVKKGHQNLVFHEGDSLSLQVTAGVRDFINRASDGRSFKMSMMFDLPILLENETTYANRYTNSKGDTTYVAFPYSDFSRYDFSSIKDKPARLKLWLASKRGEE